VRSKGCEKLGHHNRNKGCRRRRKTDYEEETGRVSVLVQKGRKESVQEEKIAKTVRLTRKNGNNYLLRQRYAIVSLERGSKT
jgi:hypothetical protein